MTNDELKDYYRKLNIITKEFGLSNTGTEICDKLDDVLVLLRKEYKKNNPDLYMIEVIQQLEDDV